jgi:hypothetical protein
MINETILLIPNFPGDRDKYIEYQPEGSQCGEKLNLKRTM